MTIKPSQKELTIIPEFNLKAVQANEEYELNSTSLNAGSFILYTYPKDLTSGCTTEANNFSEKIDFFEQKNIKIFGLSKDSIKSHRKFIDKEKIKFPLISDPDCDLIRKLGCWVKKSMYGKEYMGISRTTFLVDKKLMIRKIWRNVKVKNHIEDVMAEIDSK